MSSFSRELTPKNNISEQCPRPCLRIGFLSGPATARQKRCHGAWFRTMRMFMAMMNPLEFGAITWTPDFQTNPNGSKW